MLKDCKDKFTAGNKMKSKARTTEVPSALATEWFHVSKKNIWHGMVGVPVSICQGVFLAQDVAPVSLRTSVNQKLGARLLEWVSDLGPAYGKAAQVLLSRLNIDDEPFAREMNLENFYGQWPSIPFSDIEKILDEDIPSWREDLIVEPIPVGVASIAQVHQATDQHGKKWVLKVVKPHARQRLLQSVDAIEAFVKLYRPLAMTKQVRQGLRQIQELARQFRLELDLSREHQTILRVQEKMTERRRSILRVPEVHPHLQSSRVLVVELFEGTKLSDIASGKVQIKPEMKRKLARKMLKDLLIQVFEMGLFHGDPHAGNLILLEDGAVGLFDWGLAGELLESDRIHIASMLKAVMALDFEKLCLALQQMAQSEGREVPLDEIRKELRKVAKMVKDHKAKKKTVSMQQMIKSCLESAEKMDLRLPDGLLLMAKSLITIEGLAKGIDADINFGTVASPFLFRAAKPGLKELVTLGVKAPGFLYTMIKSER